MAFLRHRPPHKMVDLLLLLNIVPYRGNKNLLTMQIHLQRVSTYFNSLGYQGLFSGTFAIIQSQHYCVPLCKRSNPVPPYVQVLLIFGFLATRTFSAEAGRWGGHITAVHQLHSLVSRECNKSTGHTVHKVSIYS